MTIWDDEMDVDVDDLFHDVLDKAKEWGRPNLWRPAGLSMAGWKRWGQKLCSIILCAITR